MTANTANAFDGAAADYDARFAGRELGRWLRARVHDQLGPRLRPGMRALELGCGTGEDALWLASLGLDVVATDASPAMIGQARAKADGDSRGRAIRFQALDARDPAAAPEVLADGPFDLVFSNFGALNCVPDRGPLAAWAARAVAPGGLFAATLMGPFCLWETLRFMARGRLPSAFRRAAGPRLAAVGPGAAVEVCYPRPARFRRDFAPDFVHQATVAVGVLLPTSDQADLVDRHPGLFRRLERLDRRLAPLFPFRFLGDHYFTILRRLPAPDGGARGRAP